MEQVFDMIDVKPSCPCGNGVIFWSGLLEQGFCSEECYQKVLDKRMETSL